MPSSGPGWAHAEPLGGAALVRFRGRTELIPECRGGSRRTLRARPVRDRGASGDRSGSASRGAAGTRCRLWPSAARRAPARGQMPNACSPRRCLHERPAARGSPVVTRVTKRVMPRVQELASPATRPASCGGVGSRSRRPCGGEPAAARGVVGSAWRGHARCTVRTASRTGVAPSGTTETGQAARSMVGWERRALTGGDLGGQLTEGGGSGGETDASTVVDDSNARIARRDAD